MSIWTTTLLVIALLAVNAFFVASEFALISSRKDRIESLIAQGRKGADKVLHAIENLSTLLAGAQLGITIASLVLGKVAEPAITHLLEGPFQSLGVPEHLMHPISFIIALTLITYLHILFGEMVPKNIAIAGPERLAMWLAPPMLVWTKITRPFLDFLNFLARHILGLFGIEQKDELESSVNQAQLAMMIRESREEGLLDAEEHARLAKALRGRSRSLTEVMIPLGNVRTVAFGTSGPRLGDIERAVEETGFSRFPVTGRDNSYLGYVHIKDVLDNVATEDTDHIIPRSDIRPLIIVDAAGSIDEALRKLHRRSAHMAQVRDHGELVGLITLEDLIEEYVGTVNDWTHEDV